ncbi:MAG: hypothetical protein AB2L09_12880 [Coriobacteriia bacterium]
MAGWAEELNQTREALRLALAERGLRVESDTASCGRSLYIMGDNDLACAMFEFYKSAAEAAEAALYQGAWVEGLPPRFAVLPASARNEDDFDLLGQIHIIPLIYIRAEGIEFPELDQLLKQNL